MLKYSQVKEEHIKLILGWRRMPHVAKNMLSDIENSIEKQGQWFKNIGKDKSSIHRIISYENKFIGLVYITNIDFNNNRCKLGYYIAEIEYIGLGGLFLAPVYNYIFYKLELNKIYGEVLDGNSLIISIHKYHGWRAEGTYKKHIIKENKYYDIHLFELLKDDWLNNNHSKHNSYSMDFEE